MLLWGRNHGVQSVANANGYLAETTLQFAMKNRVWGRIENVDRTSELLFGKSPAPAGLEEEAPLARVQAYTAGYDRDFHWIPGIATALGGQMTFYGAPESLRAIYGAHPLGAILFVRLRPAGNMHMHMH
jgi:hypothetical protein